MMEKITLSHRVGLALPVMCLWGCLFAGAAFSETFIVKNGRPQAEIIISDKPARMTKLAVSNLQEYVYKITGATLAITNVPSENVPVKIYVGKSKYTDELKLSTEGLAHGAFRMASGKDYLALLGPDKDFVPMEPWTHDVKDRARALKDWDALNPGDYYGFPYARFSGKYNAQLDIWLMDDGGTMNAVCEFLRGLGVRWYFPGELGEVVPKKESIALPAVDKTVKPDFPMRHFNNWFNDRDNILWNARLGVNFGQEMIGLIQTSHGSKWVYMRDEVKKAHPDWYAIFSGKRATKHSYTGAPCFSSEELFKQHLKFARFVFDVRKEPMLSIDACDGYGRGVCECALCKGKGTPERGWNGSMSDYVWGYVNRVATELYKTHPDRKVGGSAYGAYELPPTNIDKLPPNLALLIIQQRCGFYDRAQREATLKTRQAWLDKVPSKEVYIVNHYLSNCPLFSPADVPIFYPRLIAEDLRSLKGISMGDMNEVYLHNPNDPNKPTWDALAVMHLNIYVTTRFWWDVNQDLDAMLDEYYKLFYGPAEKEMKAFVEYSETNWPLMTKKMEPIDKTLDVLTAARKAAGDTIYSRRVDCISKALDLLAAARKAAGDTIYGRRVDRLVECLKPLKQLRDRLAKGRKNVPTVQAQDVGKITLDGKLDEWSWKERVCNLKELETGRAPELGATFRFVWGQDNALYLGIRCNELDTKALNITATRNDDTNIWSGDYIEIVLETQVHSYYRIAINPAGAMADADMKGGTNTLWSSGAKAAAFIGDGFWSAEIRLPAAGDTAQELDPLKGISGRKPDFNHPWCVNVCRQRVRQNDTERSAWSPTGSSNFDDVMKLGAVYVGHRVLEP